jgi:exonuclease III
VEGYSCNRADRNCSGGGVATYIKADLNPTNLDSLQEEARALDLEITISAIELSRGRSLIVIGAYRPPSARMNWFTDFDSILLKLLTLGQIVIMGDVNADL